MNIAMQAFINVFHDKMNQRLQAKTGWGRVELAIEMEAALSDAMAEFIVLTVGAEPLSKGEAKWASIK